MVAWFLIAIATLMVFGFVAVNGVQTVAMTSDAVGRVETVRRLDAAVNGLLARAASPDGNGVMYLPAGSPNPEGQGYGLPVDMGTMATTPFGKYIVYCPFGDNGQSGTSAQVSMANGSSYNVAVKGFEGRNYVVGGRPPFPAISGRTNLIGFVMAPRTKLSETPSCNQVIFNATTRRFEAPDAIVRPVSREGGIDEARTEDARRLTFYVSPSGDGKGGSAADPASFASALNYYRTHLPSNMTINMAGGNYGMGPSDLSIPYQTNNFASNLTINGAENGTFVQMTGPGDIVVPGDLVLTGVAISSEARVIVGSDKLLRMINSSVGAVDNAGNIQFSGVNSITGANAYPLKVLNGGQAAISGTLQVYTRSGYGIRVYGGSDLAARSAVIRLASSTGSQMNVGIALEQRARLELAEVSVQLPEGASYGVYAQGADISFYSSTMEFGGAQSVRGIVAMPGSTVSLRLSRIGLGVAPSYGVLEIGATSAFGEETSIYATSDCWRGNLFSESLHASGSLSEVRPYVDVDALPADPTGAQIRLYSEQQATNTRRAALRVSNTSTWRCNA